MPDPLTAPPPSPITQGRIGGHLLPLRREPPQYLLSAARDLGDVVRLKLGPQEAYLFRHPDAVGTILVTQHADFEKSWEFDVMRELLGGGLLTSEGEEHRRQRRLVLPAFHHGRIQGYGARMVRHAEAWSARWSERLDRADAEVRMDHEMSALTLVIVGEALFGEDLGAEAPAFGQALGQALESYFRFLNPLRFALRRLPTPTAVRFTRARRHLHRTVDRMIADHRRRGSGGDDLMAMLLQAQHEDDGSFMTDEQVRDQAMTLLLAGHETTALALTWTWYLLARHPEAEAALHAELDAVLGGRPPATDDLPALVVTRQVVTESMRLYPPAWVTARRARRDVEVAGVRVPKGTNVWVSPYVTHRDGRFFPDPEAFRPGRWTPEFRRALPKFAYFPFGAGPRVCIGEQFAWMEAILVLATLAQHWAPRRPGSATAFPQSRLTLRPKGGLRMRLARR